MTKYGPISADSNLENDSTTSEFFSIPSLYRGSWEQEQYYYHVIRVWSDRTVSPIWDDCSGDNGGMYNEQQQISGKLLDLEKQIRSSPQLFQKETSDAYFQSVYSTLRSDFLVWWLVVDTITDLSNALSTASDVVSGIFDKKRSEIESLNQRLDSLIAVDPTVMSNP